MTAPAHRWPVRVYYEDTDFSGVVYHAAYLRFLERGRTEWLRALGIDQAALFAEGLVFAVRKMTISFRAPAHMDEEVVVQSCLSALGGASIEMRQTLTRAGSVLVEATVRIGLVEGGRAVRLPHGLARTLRRAAAWPDDR